MKFSAYFSNEFKKQNPMIHSILEHYDSNLLDKKDGVYSKSEVKAFIDDSVFGIGKFFAGKNSLTDLVFKLIDKDSDNFITKAELDEFVRTEYSFTLDDIENKKVLDVCDMLDKAVKKKKERN